MTVTERLIIALLCSILGKLSTGLEETFYLVVAGIVALTAGVSISRILFTRHPGKW